jgi:asparaginyl-tRNA synthetase
MEQIRELLAGPAGRNGITASGWIRTKRDSGRIIFIELNDGSSMASLQAVVDNGSGTWDEALLRRLQTGASVTVTGTLRPSEGKNQDRELLADTISVLGDCPPEYPLQKKRHSMEYLREIAHLRPRTNTFGAVARVRSVLSYAVHRFFNERGFVLVHTPIITGSDCEGAGQMFQVTTLDQEKLPRTPEGSVDYGADFFGKKTHLTVSGQLQGENYACALGRIYTFGPTFRAENSSTTRHLAEFWMIEPEVAFCDLAGDMALAEDFIKYLLRTVLAECPAEMAFFDQWVQNGLIAGLQEVVDKPFTPLTYTAAVDILKKSGEMFEYPVEWGCDLQTEHEKYLTERHVGGPVIVTDYPKGIKAFYMKQNDDGKTVRAMDVLVPRLGEIIGGSQREEDLDRLLARIRELGLREEDYWWYLDLRRFGSVPHAGFGLGFERLVQYVTGMQNIRDVIPFPRTVRHADF